MRRAMAVALQLVAARREEISSQAMSPAASSRAKTLPMAATRPTSTLAPTPTMGSVHLQ